jgi:hypothetical protein
LKQLWWRVHAPEAPELVAVQRRRGPKTYPIGQRERVIRKVGSRQRRAYYVAPEDLLRDDCWLDEPGWYVDTVRPPAAWMNNDPHGPYPTLAALQRDTDRGYLQEEDEWT